MTTSTSSPKSPVWFWNLRAGFNASRSDQLTHLLHKTGYAEHVHDGNLVAIKTHFGERGNSGFLAPLTFVPIVAYLASAGAAPFLADTNTLYAGNRGNAAAHALQAARHGFDPLLIGAPVVIADGLRSHSEVEVAVPDAEHETTCYLARDFVEADLLVTVSHFKGHPLAGYGGALKNAAMGCATRRGKMQQHALLGPAITRDNCTGCGVCPQVCAPGALTLDDERRIVLDPDACIGCGSCFHACRFGALTIDWKTDREGFQKRMLDYAAAACRRERPSLHLLFVQDVTPECDCLPFSDAPLCPDLGVLASYDPVAIDQAALDMVRDAPVLPTPRLPKDLQPGQDKFHAANPGAPADFGLAYAEKLGLGSRDYKLLPVGKTVASGKH